MAVSMAGDSASSTTTARCSTCHAELDIARHGEHICSIQRSTTNSPFHVPSSNTFAMDRVNGSQLSSNNQRNIQLQGKLPKFAPPARIDPFAANEVFHTNQPGTPNSFLETGSNSPARIGSPASAARFRMPPRSATTPYFHDRPPSPDMLMPQDSAFPVFPTKKVRQEQAKRDRQRSKSVSRSQSRDRATFRPGTNAAVNSARSASPAVTHFPARPSTANSSSRKGSVSSLKSPADAAMFGGLSEPVPPIPTQHDTGGRGSPKLDGRANIPFELPDNKTGASVGPTSPLESENLLQQQQQQRSPESPNLSKQYAAAPAIKPLDAIGSTRKPNQDLSLNIPRGQGIVGSKNNGTDSNKLLFAEPAPTTPLGSADDWTVHNFTSEQHPSAPSRTNTSVEESSDEDRTEDGLGNLPSFGKSYDAGASTAPNRLRTSASSDGSQYSATHSVSSRSSPPTSASSLNTQDSIPKPDSIDNALDEPPADLRQSLSNEPTIPVITPGPAGAHPSPLQIRPRAPAKSFSRPNYIRPQLEAIGTGNVSAALASPRQNPYGQPVIPVSQNESSGGQQQSLDTRLSSQDERSSNTEPRLQAVTSPMSPADRPFSPMTPRTQQTPIHLRNGDTSFHPPRRPTTPGFKGNCRGCGEMIVGKSVSSADGRLTGRYHKQCFVCQTCKEPFQTADFYVINNQPYCQRHYHTLNGSICENCDRGIEGPYMETDAKKKFHPHCFTCKECHLILRSDYFEINGVIYCEKHSHKPDLLGPGRRFPERRTTRLMMM